MAGPSQQKTERKQQKKQKAERKQKKAPEKKYVPRSAEMESVLHESGLADLKGPNPLGEAVQEGRSWNPANFHNDPGIVKGVKTDAPSLQKSIGPKPQGPEHAHLFQDMQSPEEEKMRSHSMADGQEDEED